MIRIYQLTRLRLESTYLVCGSSVPASLSLHLLSSRSSLRTLVMGNRIPYSCFFLHFPRFSRLVPVSLLFCALNLADAQVILASKQLLRPGGVSAQHRCGSSQFMRGFSGVVFGTISPPTLDGKSKKDGPRMPPGADVDASWQAYLEANQPPPRVMLSMDNLLFRFFPLL